MCYKLLLLNLSCVLRFTSADYWAERTNLMALDASEAIGSNITLSSKEEYVNKVIMKFKLDELRDGLHHPEHFLPAKHIFHAKSDVEKSKVFKFINMLPKGSSLHSHSSALVSGDYLYNLTYREGLYGCVGDENFFLDFSPNQHKGSRNCTLLSTLRRENSSFDDFLKSQISLVVDDPEHIYPDINDVWKKFSNAFKVVNRLLTYIEVFKDYFYQSLQELYDDNVMYLEVRSALTSLYDLDGTVYKPLDALGIYVDIVDKFKNDHPDFHGVRLIYAPKRHTSQETLAKYLQTAIKLKEKFPKFIAGFDLVGQEDKGAPLIDFIPELLNLSGKMKFFFHAGETIWNGMETDFNLVDAVLLNVSRIGHGYALYKHNAVMNMVKERGITIEVCPVSNQVLKLVRDMRNHAAGVLISRGFNIVICSDDPTFFGTKGLSYDWYMVFMGMTSWQSDLRLLKQLAINSILYSAMESEEKEDAIKKWNKKWEQFLDRVVNDM